MKRKLVLGLLLMLLTGFYALPVFAADVTAGMDINSAYVWRGQTFNDGAVIQPSVDVSKNGFGFNVWGNFDLDDYDNSLDDGEFSEVDLTLSYTHSFGMTDLCVGYIEYLFPATEAGGVPGTREYYISLGLNLPAGFSVGLAYYYDFDEVEDYYSVLSVGYGYALTKKLSLETGASIAYAGDGYCADDSAGLYDYTLSTSLGYAVNDALSIALNMTYVGAADDDNLQDIEDGGPHDVDFVWGVNVSYSF